MRARFLPPAQTPEPVLRARRGGFLRLVAAVFCAWVLIVSLINWIWGQLS